MSRFANVPLEITRCIASYLPSHSLLELCCTCKSLQAALLLDLYRQIHLSDPQRLVFLLNALVHSSNIFDRRDAIHTLILAFPIDTLLLEVLAVLCPRATRFDISHPAQHPPSPLTSDLVSQYRAQVFPDRTQFSVRPLSCLLHHQHLTSLTLQWIQPYVSHSAATVFFSLPNTLLHLKIRPGHHTLTLSNISLIHDTCPKLESLEIIAHDLRDVSDHTLLVVNENHTLKSLHLTCEHPWPQPWQWFWFIGKKYARQLSRLVMVGNIGRMPGEDTVVEQCYTTFVDQHAATVQSLELSLVLTKSIFWEKLTRRSSQLVLAGLDASTYRRTVTPYNTGNVGNDENTVNHPSKLRRALICYKPTVRSFNLTLPSPPLRTHPVYRTEQTFETFCELEGFGQLQHLTLSIPNIPGKRESIGTLPFNNLLQHCPQLTRLDVQKSSLFTSIAGVPASHSLVHLSLDQCYLPEQLLSTAFADLPCLMTFIMDQSTVLLRNTDTPRPDLTIPLELARSDGVAVTIRRLRGLTYRKRRARYVLFGQVTLAHTHRPSRATTWRITHDGQMEETSNGKNQPKQQASSGDSPLHLNIIAENISSFQYESHLVK